MKHILFLIGVALSVVQLPLRAENVLIQVYQPTSLLGTEMDGDPLGTGESIAAKIVSRPILVGGAFPESTVSAVSLPHRLAGAGEGFPDESNLIVIIGAKIHAEHGQKEHKIIADFSQAKVPENLGVNLYQVMQMTALCLQKTLGEKHQVPIRISWMTPEGALIDVAKLPIEIK